MTVRVRLAALAALCAACGPGQLEASRCVQRATLFELDRFAILKEADTTGDGVPELWGVWADDVATFGIGFVRAEDGSYEERLQFELAGLVHSFADVNGDGRDDLVVSIAADGGNRALRAYLSGSDGKPGMVTQELATENASAWVLGFMDLNADGRDDTVSFDPLTHSFTVDLGDEIRVERSDVDVVDFETRIFGIADNPSGLVVVGALTASSTPAFDVLELVDGALERRWRGEAPFSPQFPPLATRGSDGTLRIYTAGLQDGASVATRLDIDSATGDVEKQLLADELEVGRFADLDGDGYIDMAWRESGKDRLHARFGESDEEMGSAHEFPDAGAVKDLGIPVELDGAGVYSLVVSHGQPESLSAEAISFTRCES